MHLLYSGKSLQIRAPSNLSHTRFSGILKLQQKCGLESKKYGNIVSNVFVSNLNIKNKTTYLKNTASFSSVSVVF